MLAQDVDLRFRSFLVCVDGIDLREISEWIVFEGQEAICLGDYDIVCAIKGLDAVIHCLVKEYWDEAKCRQGVGAVLRAYFSLRERQVRI